MVEGGAEGYRAAEFIFRYVPVDPLEIGDRWLTLPSDVVVVAVLSSFSSTHEIQTPEAIPVFFS